MQTDKKSRNDRPERADFPRWRCNRGISEDTFGANVQFSIQHYKFLHAAVTICANLVNTQSGRQTRAGKRSVPIPDSIWFS